MENYQYLRTKLRDITDAQILTLIREMEAITGISPQHDSGSWLFHYLSQCIYPNGDGKSVPITKGDLDEIDPCDSFVLRKKVRNLIGTPIYELCQETCRHFGEGIESHEGQSLYLFINRFFSFLKRKKRNPPRRFFH